MLLICSSSHFYYANQWSNKFVCDEGIFLPIEILMIVASQYRFNLITMKENNKTKFPYTLTYPQRKYSSERYKILLILTMTLLISRLVTGHQFTIFSNRLFIKYFYADNIVLIIIFVFVFFNINCFRERKIFLMCKWVRKQICKLIKKEITLMSQHSLNLYATCFSSINTEAFTA